MFKLLRKIEYKENIRSTKLEIDSLNNGVNYLEDFIIYKNNQKFKINRLFRSKYVSNI